MEPTAPVAERIAERIRREGALAFDAFMEAALYDPAEGFYASPPVGEGGDFVTSPHVSPAFGVLLARLVEDLWIRLGRPMRFRTIEVGAGDGTLAERILSSLPDAVVSAGPYVAVERSAGARSQLAELAARLAAPRSLRVLGRLPAGRPSREPAPGVLLANELLDNLPFRRFRGTKSAPVELRVGLDEDGARFVLVESPPGADDALALAGLAPGEEAIRSPAAIAFLERAARSIGRGYIVLFDYPISSELGSAAVHGYRRHRVEADVLDAPGTRDITSGVDFAPLIDRARSLGLTVWGPIRQREALVNLGFREWEHAVRRRQTAASQAGDGRRAVRAYSARTRAGLLLAPEGLGGFTVLCLGVGDPPRPDLLLDGEPRPRPEDTIELDLRERRIR
jgi:NADH dehydrogenase [ubiquinone] 1 alpha subcomplex assembly factor 7